MKQLSSKFIKFYKETNSNNEIINEIEVFQDDKNNNELQFVINGFQGMLLLRKYECLANICIIKCIK